MSEKRYQIEISEEVYNKLKELIKKEDQYETIDSYVEDMLKEKIENAETKEILEEEEKEVEERLKKLGYL